MQCKTASRVVLMALCCVGSNASCSGIDSECAGTAADCSSDDACETDVAGDVLLNLRREKRARAVGDASAETSSAGDDADSPQPFINIEMATYGYHIYYADPTPDYDDKNLPNMDTGLIRRPLFKIDYSDGSVTSDRRHTLPNGYMATNDRGCSTVFSSKSSRDSYEYQSMTTSETSITGKAKADVKFPPINVGGKVGPKLVVKSFVRAEGKLAYKQKQIDSGNMLKDQRLIRSVAKCASYVVAISFGHMPEPDPTFHSAVSDLRFVESSFFDPTRQARAFWDLFDLYGTHFLTTVKMGARYSVTSYIKNTDYGTVQRNADGFGVTVGAVGGAVAKVSIGKVGVKASKVKKVQTDLVSPEEVKVASAVSNLISRTEASSVGAPLTSEGAKAWMRGVGTSPVPIKFEYQKICRHPSFAAFDLADACETYMSTYCSGRLTVFGATCEAAAERECSGDLDCTDGSVCKNYACVEVPQCEVSIYSETSWNGERFTFPFVNIDDHPTGKSESLTNGDWANKIQSIKLGHGCQEVELVDDDGDCKFGKPDNGHYRGSQHELPWDLEEDVCKIKIKAKPVPDAPAGSLLEVSAAAAETGNQTLRYGPSADEVAELIARRVQNEEKRGASVQAELQVKLQVDSTNIHVKNINTNGYIKNIGKGMYGYNGYLGAPLSSDNSGTDPGFVHRRLWDTSYDNNNLATFEDITQHALVDEKWRDVNNVLSQPSPLVGKVLHVPDGWKVTKGNKAVCFKEMKSQEVKTERAYKDDVSSSFNPIGARLDIGVVSFSYSSEMKEFRERNFKQKQAMISTKAECMDYILEMDEANPPKTSANFQHIVNSLSLGSEDTASEFYALFSMFGLEYPTKLIFGARYGYTSYFSEKSYSETKKNSESSSVSAAVTQQLGSKHGIGVSLQAQVDHKSGSSDSSSESHSSSSLETKEFAIGRRLPETGGVEEWVKNFQGEPMPTRFTLTSICNHPALADVKEDCNKYSALYCKNYLAKDEGEQNCDPAQEVEPECLWNMDCPANHICNDGTCVAPPACEATIYTDDNFGGESRLLGPIGFENYPNGMVYDTKGFDIKSMKWTGGCEEVLLVDEDYCLEEYADNYVFSNRLSNFPGSLDSLPWDLSEDVCKIKLKAKKEWHKKTADTSLHPGFPKQIIR